MTTPPPETRSQDRLGELELRLEAINSTVQTHFAQSSQEIADLKKTTSRLEELLKLFEQRLSSPPIVDSSSPPNSATGKQPLGATGNGDGGSSSIIHSRIPTFGTFQEQHYHPPPPPHSLPYFISTKQRRVEFPRFDETDFRGWAYCCRQFFEVDGTPSGQHIRLLSIHLEGHALRRHQTFMRHRAFTDIRWEDYFTQMEEKFTDIREEHPLIALKKLQQGDELVADYERKFDELLSEVNVLESIVVNLFIGGLRSDICQFVLNFSPPSLASATCSTRLQEATIRTLHEHTPVRDHLPSSLGFSPHASDSGSKFSTVLGSNFGPFTSTSTDTPKSLTQPTKSHPTASSPGSTMNSSSTLSSGSNSRPTRHLTKREMDDRRRQGLCYWCPAKYSSGHRCQDSQVYLLPVDDDDDYFEDALGATTGVADGSVHAMEGSLTPSTLKQHARIKTPDLPST